MVFATDIAHPAAPITRAPIVGLLGVLLGALISTVYGRITGFGLADIRGAVHAGVDEGAWITTAQSVGQMLVAPFAVWLGMAFGVRRVLVWSIPVFALASFLIPFATNLDLLLFGQFVAGLASGMFVPVIIGYVARNLPGPYLVYGFAAYAFNLELSLNVSASLEGYYLEHWSWGWIFWQNLFLAPLMFACVWIGVPREPVNKGAIRSFDGWGMTFFSLSLTLVYAALDQGNRLDWLNSGLIVGLLAGGGVLMLAFLMHELRTPTPWLRFGLLTGRNFAWLLLLLATFRFASLATAYVIPQFLTQIHGFRALQTGDALIWIALPQIVLAPLVALLLRRMEERIGIALGFAMIGVACLMVARGLTQVWESDDFLPSQLLQAVGQTLGLTSLVVFFVKHLRPADTLAFGALVQTARLFSGELDSGFMQTFVRVREQVNSNLIGQNIVSGNYLTQTRLNGLAASLQVQSPGVAPARAAGLLGQTVQGQSYVLAYIDAFEIVLASVIASLVVVALLRAAPPPAAPAR